MPEVHDRDLLHAALRQDLLAFTIQAFGTVDPAATYQHNWHIEAVTHRLHEVAQGNITRLLITQPPRSLKSICTSVALVAWMLGHNPALKFICVSYSSELAGELARLFRMVIDAPWYRACFPAMRAAKDTGLELVTTAGGGRLAVSVGGSLTGRGADVVIIDDPLKAEEALSKLARERVINWYKGTLVSRLNDKTKGAILIVMQRLHEEDLAGYVRGQGGFDYLDLPAIAQEHEEIPVGAGDVHVREKGDVLHERQEPHAVLDKIKVDIGSLNFSAQYLQRPVPAEGNLIRKAWLKTYEHVPAHDRDGRVVQSWDTAVKAGDSNDYSVCTTWLVKGRDYYLLDILRERLEYPMLRRRVADMAYRFAAHTVLIEDAGAGTTLIQDLTYGRMGMPRPIGITPEGDKLTRMATHAALIEAGHIHLPSEAPWLDSFLNELLAFPYGKYDDQVDSVSQFLKWARERYLLYGRVITLIGAT